MTRNHADAADAAQDAFLDAFRGLAAFDAGRPFYAGFHLLLRKPIGSIIESGAT